MPQQTAPHPAFISVPMDKGLRRAIEVRAEAEDRSLAYIVRLAARQYLAQTAGGTKRTERAPREPQPAA